MNKAIASQIKSIRDKAGQLVAEKNQLQKENRQLRDQLEKKQAELNQQQEQLSTLQQQLQALQLLQGTMDEAEKKELQRSIDKYIRDIDKTITLLSE